MKTQTYIVKIEMPDGDKISPTWLKDLIQSDCDVEDSGRQIVSVSEVIESQGLDETPKKDWLDKYNEEVDAVFGSSSYSEKGLDEAAHEHAANNGGRWLTDDIGIKCFAFNPQEVKDAFKAGAKWMAEQGLTLSGRVLPGTHCNLYVESDWFNIGEKGFKYDDNVIVQIRKS